MSVDPARQRVTVDGRAVRAAGPVTWLALNKPVGYVVSRGDPEDDRRLRAPPNVPGSRTLDDWTDERRGLLLFTTDGAAAHRLMHPRYAVPAPTGCGSTAMARPRCAPPSRAHRRSTVAGAVVDFRVRPVGAQHRVEVTLAEGRQRIVRRLAEALGLKVEW